MAAAGWVLHVRTSNAHAATVAPRQAGGGRLRRTHYVDYSLNVVDRYLLD